MLRRRSFSIAIVVFVLLIGGGRGVAFDETFPVRLISLLTTDDTGLPIGFPISVYFDDPTNETYVISSSGRITVYDENFFPVASFGKGRRLSAPRALAVDRQGNVYVCQGRAGTGPSTSPRVTIYNQAFFPINEIVFADIPGLEEYHPDRIALNQAGDIYLTGTMNHQPVGALVLDSEGHFSHWLRPKDMVYRTVAVPDSADSAEPGPDKGAVEDVPPPLRPVVYPVEQWGQEESDEEHYPVFLDDVEIDKNGRIYLLSREVSRIYVFDAGEKQLFRFGAKGGAEGKLSNPMGIAVDYDRRVVAVADYMRHTLLFYDYDYGTFIYESGGRGRAPMWFNFPNDIAISGQGHVIVSDLFNQRVQAIGVKMMDERLAPVENPSVPEVGEPPAPAEDLVAVAAPNLEPVAPITPIVLGRVGIPLGLPDKLPGFTGADLGRVAGPSLQAVPALAPQEIIPSREKRALPVAEAVTLFIPTAPAGVSEVSVVLPAKLTLLAEIAEELIRDDVAATTPGSGGSPNNISVALMVYGPVVALVGLGSWMLRQR